jgi:hypothetical protein
MRWETLTDEALDGFPARAIRIVVPFPASDLADVQAAPQPCQRLRVIAAQIVAKVPLWRGSI